MLEAEIKASLEGVSPEALLARAEAMGFRPAAALSEIDTYFNGNDRDFRRTDEALRLRRVVSLDGGGEESVLTYKGPKLDQISSARTEHETSVSDGAATAALLQALGYRPLFQVEKQRREYRLEQVTLCYDQVKNLGPCLELETLAPSEDAREAAVARLLTLLDALQVPRANLTRQSYLELLVKKASQKP